MTAAVPGIGTRIADALRAACHPAVDARSSVGVMAATGLFAPAWGTWVMTGAVPVDGVVVGGPSGAAATSAAAVGALDVDALVVDLFEAEGRSLVRLVRLFVDDRNAAEDLVQEAFIRLARSAHRIDDPAKAAAYLRSIVLNLARDHNRRGLVSLRHHLPLDDQRASLEDEIVLRDDQQQVIDALRELPHRQRDCLVLRYYHELGIDAIGETLGISPNSVKTHLKRGLAALEQRLEHPLARAEAHR